ncbi:MAG: CehA/McbA family metallohydrolase [Anaerolineales bacterium]
MDELTVNLHMHTCYSDGSGTHADLAQAALRSGVDVLLVTDHNVWVQGIEGYHESQGRRVLLLVGEEIHDQARDPQKNHLLVFGAERELAPLADAPQRVIDAAARAGGLSFLAHPIDPALPAFGETDISWEDWSVDGYTGLELWNGFSELKVVVKSKLHGLFYAYFPEYIARGPLPQVLKIWDDLLAQGRRLVAIGGSDAHARLMTMGPLRRVIFPYEYHFSAVNTHLLTPAPLSGVLEADRKMVYESLAAGHCFIGYDLPASTRGFRFSAHGPEQNAIQGDEIALKNSVTLQVKIPGRAHLRLLQNGRVIKQAYAEALTHVAAEPGVYRVEVYRHFLGRLRGWIYSNPIYVR